MSRPDDKPETGVGHGRIRPRDSLEEKEQLALRLPLEWQAGVFHQPVRGELCGMPAVEDRRDHIGCEEGEPDEARDVGTDDPLLRRIIK